MDPVAILVAASIAAGASVGVYALKRTAPSAPASVEAKLAYERPRPLPSLAPTGQATRDLESDAWVLHPGHEVSPRGVVAAFLSAERGNPQTQCDLIDDLVEGDCSLRNLFEQREQESAGKPWVMTGEGADEASAKAARVLTVALKRIATSEAFEHLIAGANRYGWGACEIDWGLVEIDGAMWVAPVALVQVEARRFRISRTNELRLYADVGRPEGDPLSPGKWIVVTRKGRLARAGLMRTAAWPAVGKRLGWRDWLVFSHRFGIPLTLATYKAGEDDDDTLTTAEQIVQKIGSDSGAVIPDSIKVELVEATKGQPNDKTHGGLIAHCNAEMAKLIAGSTLKHDNAGSGGASYALGEVHAKTSWSNVEYDASKLQEAVRTQLAVPFMKFNGLKGEPPLMTLQVVRDDTPDAVLNRMIKAKNQLGLEVSVTQVREACSLREPVNDDDKAKGMQVESFPAAGGGIPS